MIRMYSHNNRLSRRIRTFLAPVSRSIQSIKFDRPDTDTISFQIVDHPSILLVTGMLSALFLAVVPYRPDLNAAGILVGIDAHYYVEWIAPMLDKPFLGAGARVPSY